MMTRQFSIFSPCFWRMSATRLQRPATETSYEIFPMACDLLLLDLWLSGWSGRDICISLKSQEATRHLPIILISANNETEKIAHEAGADDFLAKPFNLDEVQEKIENFL